MQRGTQQAFALQLARALKRVELNKAWGPGRVSEELADFLGVTPSMVHKIRSQGLLLDDAQRRGSRLELIGEFCRDLGGVESDQLLELLSAGKHSRPAEAIARLFPSEEFQRSPWFIDRVQQLAFLQDRMDAARADGGSSVVLIEGDPGMGKSSLILEVIRAAQTNGFDVHVGFSHETDGPVPPYLPIRDLLSSVIGASFTADPSEPATPTRISQVVFGTSGPAGIAGNEEAAQLALADEILEELLKRPRPALLVVEDVQAADHGSLEVVRYLARSLRTAGIRRRGRVLLVLTFSDKLLQRYELLNRSSGSRVHPLVRLINDTYDQPSFFNIKLPPFEPTHVLQQVATLRKADDNERFASEVYRQTKGNPMYVREAVRMAEQRGTDQDHHLPGARYDSAIQIRLAELTPGALEFIECASVIGDSFEPALVGAMMSRRAETPPANAMSELETLDFLRYARGGKFQFTHSLVRTVIYERLEPGRRRELHRRAVETILAVAGDDELEPWLGALVVHASAAEGLVDSSRLVEYASRAAANAARSYAWTTAAQYWDVAVSTLGKHRRSQERRLELLRGLGGALMAAGQPVRVFEEVAPEAYTIALETGPAEAVADVCIMATKALDRYGSGRMVESVTYNEWVSRGCLHAPPETEQWVRTQLALANAAVPAGGRAQSKTKAQILREALAVANRLGDLELSNTAVAAILASPGPPEQWADRLTLATTAFTGLSESLDFRVRGTLLGRCGEVFQDAGDRALHNEATLRLRRLSETTQDADLLLRVLIDGTVGNLLRGDTGAVLSGVGELRKTARELGAPLFGLSWASTLAFRAHLQGGDHAAARTALQESLDFEPDVTPWWLDGVRALYYAHAGQPREYREAIQSFTHGRRIGDVGDSTDAWILFEVFEAGIIMADRSIVEPLYGRLAILGHWAKSDLAFSSPARLLGEAALTLGLPKGIAEGWLRQAVELCERAGFVPEFQLAKDRLAELAH